MVAWVKTFRSRRILRRCKQELDWSHPVKILLVKSHQEMNHLAKSLMRSRRIPHHCTQAGWSQSQSYQLVSQEESHLLHHLVQSKRQCFEAVRACLREPRIHMAR
jgi:hypothetical protein